MVVSKDRSARGRKRCVELIGTELLIQNCRTDWALRICPESQSSFAQRNFETGSPEPGSQYQVTTVFLENDGYGRFVRFSVNTIRFSLHEELYTKSPKSVISVTVQEK